MSTEKYHEQINKHDIEATRQLCDGLPKYVSKYLKSKQHTTTPKTRLEYAKDIKNFLDYVLDSYGPKGTTTLSTVMDITCEVLNDLDKDFFDDYLDYLQMYDKDGKTYTNNRVSIKRKLSALRNFFSYLHKDGYISSETINRVEMPKIKEKEIIRMDSHETNNFVNAVEYGDNLTTKQAEYHEKQKVRDMAIIMLILSTGIRVSECVGLDLDDVDFRNSKLKITRKGGKESSVYFSDEASGYLMEYVEERKTIEAGAGSEKALFLSSRRQRISVRSIEVLVKKYAKKSVPSKTITPHKLRSTFATALYEETGDIYLVGDALGHEDIATTKKHYANLSNERKSQNRNKVSIRKSTY